MADANINDGLNLDQKVTVKNIAGWSVGFARIDTIGDVTITAEGNTRLSRNEIISQVQNGNKLFTGVDGNGSHATLYIDDAPTRKEVGFDSEDEKNKQVVFNDAAITKVFSLKTQAAFEKNLIEIIRTRAEKYALVKAIKRLRFNDYYKVIFALNYSGYKL